MNVFLAEYAKEDEVASAGSDGSSADSRRVLGVFSSLQRAMAAWNAVPGHDHMALYVTQMTVDQIYSKP